MSTSDLAIGLKQTLLVKVDDRLTVPAVAQAFTGRALKPFLAEGQRTVGTHVDLSRASRIARRAGHGHVIVSTHDWLKVREITQHSKKCNYHLEVAEAWRFCSG